MTESFDYSKDWYYWGQNRLGSFLPWLGNLFYGLGLSSFNAAGTAQLIAVGVTLFLIWKLFSGSVWVLGAIALYLFPIFPFWMQVSLGHPYLAQFLFVLLAFWLFFDRSLKERIRFALIPLVLGAAVWSSELSVAAILALALVNLKSIPLILKKNWPYLLPSASLGIFLLWKAKKSAVETLGYDQLLASAEEFWFSISQQAQSFMELLIGDTNKPFNTLIAWGFITLMLLNLGIIIRKKQKPSKLSLSLFLTAVISFFLIHLSAWNSLMGAPLRYFTVPYFFFGLSLMMAGKDLIQNTILKPILSLSLLGLSLYASLTFNRKFETGTEDRIRVDNAQRMIESFQQIHPEINKFVIIGTYWNSHLLDALSPQVSAIPFKGEQLRNMDLLQHFEENEFFIVIRNGKMEDFPLQLEEREMLFERKAWVYQNEGIEAALYRRSSKPKAQL